MLPQRATILKPKRHEYHLTHLKVINPLLPVPLTPTEREVLAAFLSLNKSKIPHGGLFGKAGRSMVSARLGMERATITVHLKALVGKGAIIKDEDELPVCLPNLIPPEEGVIYVIKIEPDADRVERFDRSGIREVSPEAP